MITAVTGRGRWISAAEWGVIAGIVAIDALCALATGIPVAGALKRSVVFLLLLPLWPLFAWRFGRKGALIGQIPAKLCASTSALSVTQYYAAMASSGRPMIDASLIEIDRALGFDWPTAHAWLAAQPWLWQVFTVAYHALLPEMGVILFVLALVAPERAARVITAMIVSIIPTLLIFWLVPVGGPFSVYEVGHVSSAVTGTEHYLLSRAGGFAAVPLDNPQGIIAFPSFHACAAVLLTWLARGVRILFPLAFILNAAMIAATPVIGGHHLIDIIAGLAVAGLTVLALQWLDGPRTAAVKLTGRCGVSP